VLVVQATARRHVGHVSVLARTRQRVGQPGRHGAPHHVLTTPHANHTLRKRGDTHIATGTSLRTMLVTTKAGFWVVHLCRYNAAPEPLSRPPAATTPSTSHPTTTSSTSHYHAVHKPLRSKSTSHCNAVPKPLRSKSTSHYHSHHNAVHKPLRRRPPATTTPSTSHYDAVQHLTTTPRHPCRAAGRVDAR
jgi:hypothetical protein